MKKTGIINSEIAAIISSLGHTDTIVIADCGLPIPPEVKRIDLALKLGTPSFLETINTILIEMEVEKAIFAKEIMDSNPLIQTEATKQLNSGSNIELEYISHEDFKKKSKEAKAIIRTGEATPYANVILVSGVSF